MKQIAFLLAMVVVVIGGMIAMPYLTGFSPEEFMEGSGDKVVDITCDRQGSLRTFMPSERHILLPEHIHVAGQTGERGHVSYGLFGLHDHQGYQDYSKVGVKVELERADVLTDTGMIRVAVVGCWMVDGDNYYVEFDIWDSPGTEYQIPATPYLMYSTGGDMPTVEVKSTQLIEGQDVSLAFPMEEKFDLFFPGLKDQKRLEMVYVVIEKTDYGSVFEIDLKLTEMRLYE